MKRSAQRFLVRPFRRRPRSRNRNRGRRRRPFSNRRSVRRAQGGWVLIGAVGSRWMGVGMRVLWCHSVCGVMRAACAALLVGLWAGNQNEWCGLRERSPRCVYVCVCMCMCVCIVAFMGRFVWTTIPITIGATRAMHRVRNRNLDRLRMKRRSRRCPKRASGSSHASGGVVAMCVGRGAEMGGWVCVCVVSLGVGAYVCASASWVLR